MTSPHDKMILYKMCLNSIMLCMEKNLRKNIPQGDPLVCRVLGLELGLGPLPLLRNYVLMTSTL